MITDLICYILQNELRVTNHEINFSILSTFRKMTLWFPLIFASHLVRVRQHNNLIDKNYETFINCEVPTYFVAHKRMKATINNEIPVKMSKFKVDQIVTWSTQPFRICHTSLFLIVLPYLLYMFAKILI